MKETYAKPNKATSKLHKHNMHCYYGWQSETFIVSTTNSIPMQQLAPFQPQLPKVNRETLAKIYLKGTCIFFCNHIPLNATLWTAAETVHFMVLLQQLQYHETELQKSHFLWHTHGSSDGYGCTVSALQARNLNVLVVLLETSCLKLVPRTNNIFTCAAAFEALFHAFFIGIILITKKERDTLADQMCVINKGDENTRETHIQSFGNTLFKYDLNFLPSSNYPK